MLREKFNNNIREKAKARFAKIALPDAEDIRVINAAIFLEDNNIAKVFLVGDRLKIEHIAIENNINIKNIEIIEPNKSNDINTYTQKLYNKRKNKGLSEIEAFNKAKNPLYFSGFLLESGQVDAVVAGNISSTSDVIRAGLYTVGLKPSISLVSSFFIMVFDDKLYCFADCAVNPNPTSEQLCDIAINSAQNFEVITGEPAKVAMLSYSTNKSASGEMVAKVQIASKLLKEKSPNIISDGEMQLDAAINLSVAQRKFPSSKVAGQANVLIFPDLNAGNIGYKLVERLAGAEAIGPIVQGFAKPYCDLSRGCSTEDIINVASICSLMA
ncbi:MAG TPA: phosphate acetyltransferase [Candidatus Kapabacteria bacterium]|nr:phosphate acetyltransferase [Candidatus Kapabacteria bacterium]